MGEQQKKRIVLVEDDEVIAALITAKLEKVGFDVHAARDGEKGLELIHTVSPDLVLLDAVLPIKSGFEILEILHDEHIIPELPVIIISNSGQGVEIEHAIELGIRDYLVKINFSPAEVLQKVEEVLKIETRLQRSTSGGPKLLIIEDDELLIDLLLKKFIEHGYMVEHVSDAKRGLETLKREHFDMILLDVVLPDADGYSFLFWVKSDPQLREIPVIIISNLGQREEIEKGLKAGAVDYIIKANTLPSDIFQRVEHVLHKINNK